MEPDTTLVKAFGFYIFFISGVDSTVLLTQLLYPISLSIIQSIYENTSNRLLILAGFLSIHSLGKLLSHLLLPRISQALRPNLSLSFLLTFSFLSMLILCLIPYYPHLHPTPILLISRFLNGLGSNIYLCMRKVLFQVCINEKADWKNYSFHLLLMSRLGGIMGLVFSVLLSDPLFILPSDSFYSKPWLMLGLVGAIMQGSGLILSLMIEKSEIMGSNQEKYEKLDEKIEKKEEEDITVVDIKDDHTGKVDFGKYIRESVIIREESVEESFNIDEVKFYSPRENGMKEVFEIKGPLTDRYEKIPQLTQMDLIADESAADNKIVNVSFGDEESQIVQVELEKIDMSLNIIQGENLMINTCIAFQIAITVLIGFIYESLPIYLISIQGITKTNLVSFIILVGFLSGCIVKLCIFGYIERKISCYNILLISLLALACFVSSLGTTTERNPNYELVIMFISLIFVCVEFVGPMGHMMISECAGQRDRESIIDKSIGLSLGCKVVVNLATPLVIQIFRIFSFYFCSIMILLMSLFLFRLKKNLDFFCKETLKTKGL